MKLGPNARTAQPQVAVSDCFSGTLSEASVSKSANEAAKQRPPARLLKLHDVMGRTKLSKATIYRWMRQGKFPKHVFLATGAPHVAWHESDVEQWILTRPPVNPEHKQNV